jgi:hypothetical protein
MMYHLKSVKNRLVAPCGINCARCLGYLREKNTCPGCRFIERDTDKDMHRRKCVIWLCTKRAGDFCGSCPALPCRRLQQLDRRYRTNYATGLIDNLLFIKKYGIRAFLRREKTEGTCPHCGAVRCIHRPACLQCGKKWRKAK